MDLEEPMRALVTGGAGFLGRHFARTLAERGWQVMALDVAPLYSMPGIELAQTELVGTVTDWTMLGSDLPQELRFDLVVHCAARSAHRVGIDNDKHMLIENLLLDAAMFDWAVRTDQGRVLYISSSAIYPRDLQSAHHAELANWLEALRLRETDVDLNDPLAPFDDYGWIKLMGEKMAHNARQCGLPVTVVRPFSGYGEDQSLDFPFPAIVNRARKGNLYVWGGPGQTRDWIHVDDLVKAALAVAESGTEEPVNLCTGIGTELGRLAEMVWDQAVWTQGGPPQPPITYDEQAPTGVFYRVGDPTRMLQHYIPQISLEEGIRRAIA